MRQIRLLLAGALFLVIASSFHLVADWYLLDSKQYSIEFPQRPTPSTHTLNTAMGQLTLDSWFYEASDDEAGNFLYGMTTSDYPDSLVNSTKAEILPKFFRGAIDGAVKNVRGKLLSEKVIEIEGFPGREIKVDYQNGQAIITMRMYLVNNTFIGIQTFTNPDKDNNSALRRFHDSFKLKD